MSVYLGTQTHKGRMDEKGLGRDQKKPAADSFQTLSQPSNEAVPDWPISTQ